MAKESKKETKRDKEVLKEMTEVIEAKSFYCPNCGRELIGKFCPECNKKKAKK